MNLISVWIKNTENEALIGFDSFEECIEYAKINNLTPVMLKKKDGEPYYRDIGYADNPISYKDYLNELGEDFSVYDISENTIDKEILDALEILKDNQVIILDTKKFFEICNINLTSYKVENVFFTIGCCNI